jgi:hypothetical protein
MNNSANELNKWLATIDPAAPDNDSWEAGFDADRQLVSIKLGPFSKLYLRPEKFVKRFYHQVYPLNIEDWQYSKQLKLYDDFCSLTIELQIRFQATLKYVQKHSELVGTINDHIKQTYLGVLDDVINEELQALNNSNWVQTGLAVLEKKIALSINELLMVQAIQSQTICHMTASFAEFPDVQWGREQVYLQVLKKTFEITEQKNKELFLQQQALEQEALAEKIQQLEHLQQAADVERQIQAQQAENEHLLLEDKEGQLVKQQLIEKRIHAEQIKHEHELKEIAFEAELLAQEKQKAKQRLLESRDLIAQLAHQAEQEDKMTLAQIQRHEQQQKRLREAEQKTQAPQMEKNMGTQEIGTGS